MKRFPLLCLTLSAALLLLGSGCRKTPAEPAQCAQVQRAPAAFLAYWYFPKGSYWVYQKRGSQPVEVDTVTVDGAETQVFQPGDPVRLLPTCTELPALTLQHSNRRYFRGFSSNNGFRGLEILNGHAEGSEWFVRQSSEASLIPLGFLWSYPQRPIGQPIANTGPTLLDTLAVTVPAGSFYRSVHLRIPFLYDSANATNYLYDYHLTHGIGYTRKVYANLGTWELRSYYIAPTK